VAQVSRDGRIYIGTSGWHYQHWVGPFYPRGTRPEAFLAHYARSFSTAEVNNTFYRLPGPETLATWHDRTPRGFTFACKASRYITHMKKLRDPEMSCRRFLEAVEVLADKLGPILFQLPPRWRVDLGRLEAFLAALPRRRFAFEFRDQSWFAPEVYRLLSQYDAAFCIYELAGRRAPVEVTSGFVYLRLHGPGGAYQGRYDDRALTTWAARVLMWRKAGRDVYCYFDNDERGYAAQNARRLIELIEGSRRGRSAVPSRAALRGS
jgi:uncharacterized protein YecE (DUF72 family)